jgi:hypothetical protein
VFDEIKCIKGLLSHPFQMKIIGESQSFFVIVGFPKLVMIVLNAREFPKSVNELNLLLHRCSSVSTDQEFMLGNQQFVL